MSVPKSTAPWLNPGETLVCFGDSLTEQQGYVPILQKELGAKGINVINAGLGGDKTPHALTRLAADVLSRKPDAVSLFFGHNDCIIGCGEWRDEPVVSPLTFAENLKWIIHLCRMKCGIKKFSINTMADRMEGVQFHKFGDCRTPYCQAARLVADDMNTLLVPLDSIFAELWAKNRSNATPEGLLYTYDGLHMNRSGYEVIADAMLREWNMK